MGRGTHTYLSGGDLKVKTKERRAIWERKLTEAQTAASALTCRRPFRIFLKERMLMVPVEDMYCS